MKIWKKNYREMILFLCGNYGLLCFLEGLPGIVVWESVVCLWIVLFVGGLWYLYFYNRRRIGAAAGIAGAGIFAVILVGRNVLRNQAGYMWRVLMEVEAVETQNVTFLLLLVMTLAATLLFLVEFVWKSHGIACLLMTALLTVGPVLGVPSNNRAVFFLILFQMSFLICGMRKTVGILTVACFAFVFLLVSFQQENLYHAAYRAEHFVHNTFLYLTGRADDAVADGHINRGNDYKTGTVQLEVETYILPAEPLYLIGFSGNRYNAGEWSRDDDAELFNQVAQALGIRQGRNTISTLYGGMYYTLNSFLSEDGIRNSRNVTIKHVSGKYRNYFKPYGGQWLSGTVYSTYYTYSGYDYRYYEQGDMKIDWNKVSKAFAYQAQWYANMQDAYMEAVYKECLDVPREKLPNLTKLCEAYPLDDFDEITAFITTTLASGASYTQMPGNAPLNKDIVEYFLFESGKGYCQHFASTATLMYRLYGIPARYVSGYIVEPSDFQLEKGLYRAHVTDESAHAWVEVFLKDYGWIPIEVTPNADGDIRPAYPGLDLTEWEHTLEKYRQDFDITIRMPEKEEVEENTGSVWEQNDISWEEYEPLLWMAEAVLFYTAILLPFFISSRRFRYLERFYEKDCSEHFSRLIQMLRYAGYAVDYDSTEKDLAEQIADYFPTIKAEDIAYMTRIAEKATYGRPKAVSRMEEAFAKELCRELAMQIYNRLKWYQKWIFKYGKLFC
ncbi:MAG: transglutaminase-like domain-containing protein [Lachnospiraceae bacterium]|nr:transglutaminase-like domain-containing protein [Lachnospiraceae bacterium]